MMTKKKLILWFLILLLLPSIHAQKTKKTDTAYFASGCFWCVEAIFESIKGVEEVISGYSGGYLKSPTYEQVITGKTGHAEAVKVIYDSSIVSFNSLVEAFFDSHDPTTRGQYPDFGDSYRSIVFYQSEEEKEIVQNQFDVLNKTKYKGKMITEIKAFKQFYKAESYHQDYKKKHPNNPYILRYSNKRLNDFLNTYMGELNK